MIPLLAAEGQGNITRMEWMPAVTALVVFSIFFLVLRVAVWPKILKGLEDRDNKIRTEIESAEEAREQAKAALAEYQESLSEARQQANEMVSKARSDAKSAAAELRAQNEAELNDLKQRATREIDLARQAAVKKLHAETAALAADIAGKILKREINANDQQRLIDESLGELTSTGSTE